MRLHGLLRIHVNVLHEPARFICADRYQRKIDPWKTPADLQEMGTVAAVACEVDLLLVDRDHEAAPQRAIAIEGRAGGKVLRLGRGDLYLASRDDPVERLRTRHG